MPHVLTAAAWFHFGQIPSLAVPLCGGAWRFEVWRQGQGRARHCPECTAAVAEMTGDNFASPALRSSSAGDRIDASWVWVPTKNMPEHFQNCNFVRPEFLLTCS